MENNKNQNVNERVNKANAELEGLLANNMGINPCAVVFNVNSEKIEDSLLTMLEKNGIEDVNSMMVRCVLKKDIRFSKQLQEAGQRTKLPFVVVLFKNVSNRDLKISGGLDKEVRNNIRHALSNFRDNAQIDLVNDDKLNKIVGQLTYKNHVNWKLKRQQQMAYTVLDSDKVMCACFAKRPEEVSQYLFDFLGDPKSRRNMNQGKSDFYLKIVVSKMRTRNRPKVDPINML
jgi:hypothetical protein